MISSKIKQGKCKSRSMCAVSPGARMARQVPKEQSSISSYDQQYPSNILALQAFKSIIKSCFGPSGRLKMIQNKCGGHVTLTSSSQRLLSTLSLSKPMLKMLSAAVEGHLRVYSDGGLNTALLACSLIEACWETQLHPMMCVVVNELLLDMCKKAMMSSSVCRIPINVASMEMLLSLTRSVISSKPGCGLVKKDLCLIVNLVVESFISSIPSVDLGQSLTIPEVQIIGIETEAPSKSHIMEGILIEAPDIPTFFIKELQVPKIESGSKSGCIRAILFNISLSGDSEEYTDVRYELAPGVTSESSNLQAMLDLADQLVDMRVGLVACQKVIHPSVKRYLRKKGILTVDRLSIRHIGAVQQITGGEVLGSFSSAIPSSCFGYLTDIKHHIMFDKSYLHLQSKSSSQCTLILCSYAEQALEEMKHVCRAAHHTLALMLKDPTGVPGAGCLNLILAHYVREQVLHLEEAVWRNIGCSKAHFLQLSETFASCLEAVSLATNPNGSYLVTDSTSHHGWLVPIEAMADPDWLQGLGKCGCGMKTANQLRASSWSIVGNLKYGTYKMDEQATGDTSRTQDGNDEYEHGVDARKVLHPIGSDSSAVRIGMSRHEPATKGKDSRGTDIILDSFPIRFNSLCVAVDIVNLVLRIGHTVEDVN